MKLKEITKQQLMDEATKRFGPDKLEWKFVCPACKHVASGRDYRDAGATPDDMGFSCIGRFQKNPHRWVSGPGQGPCDYTAGGLFNISPLMVRLDDGKVRSCFELAPATEEDTCLKP